MPIGWILVIWEGLGELAGCWLALGWPAWLAWPGAGAAWPGQAGQAGWPGGSQDPGNMPIGG